MGFHTYPLERADSLEDPSRYRYCSREELVSHLDREGVDVVADLGSGTGFYTDDVAPFVDHLYAVDIQSAMHDLYREKGVPDNVELVTAGVDTLPFDDDHLDGAYSTMTHHEYASEAAFAELARVIRPNGLLVTVDWAKEGTGESGPSTDERYDISTAIDHLQAGGFHIRSSQLRPETFLIAARLDQES